MTSTPHGVVRKDLEYEQTPHPSLRCQFIHTASKTVSSAATYLMGNVVDAKSFIFTTLNYIDNSDERTHRLRRRVSP